MKWWACKGPAAPLMVTIEVAVSLSVIMENKGRGVYLRGLGIFKH